MISWFHDYHTMVFIHIHKFIDLYSMTHVIIHIIYIYTYIYIYILFANYHKAEQMPCTFFCTKILSSDKSGSLTIC